MRDFTHKDIAIFSVLTNILGDVEADLSNRLKHVTEDDIEKLKEVTFTPEDIANFFVKYSGEDK